MKEFLMENIIGSHNPIKNCVFAAMFLLGAPTKHSSE